MYSYEDRIRAVKLFIKLGKRIGATLRAAMRPLASEFVKLKSKSAFERPVRTPVIPLCGRNQPVFDDT
jgi:hypothetical protein